jgi:hypothetical protein
MAHFPTKWPPFADSVWYAGDGASFVRDIRARGGDSLKKRIAGARNRSRFSSVQLLSAAWFLRRGNEGKTL